MKVFKDCEKCEHFYECDNMGYYENCDDCYEEVEEEQEQTK